MVATRCISRDSQWVPSFLKNGRKTPRKLLYIRRYDPVNTTTDIYSVNSNPAKESGLCSHQGLVTFEAIFPHPPPPTTLLASSTLYVQSSCLQKEGGIHSPLRLLPSLPFPLCNPEELCSVQ